MAETDVLILGAGISGLACRAGLGTARESVTLEMSDRPGGLLRTDTIGAYRFDRVLHVMHFRNAAMAAGVKRLLNGGVRQFTKTNAVWQRGHAIPYPYQYNVRDLPADIRRDCLQGYRDREQGPSPGADFESWLLAQYGEGFYRHFFGPYNRKLYGMPLRALEAEPMVWTIPASDSESILGSPPTPDRIGHPATQSCYPTGPRGMEALVHAFADLGHGAIQCGARAQLIDWKHRRVRDDTGAAIRYRSLVSSLPLPDLLAAMADVPDEIARAARSLAAAPVTCVRIGSRTSGPALPHHWTYFPDPEIPFYRLTRLERISADLCVAGGAALLLECAGNEAPDRDATLSLLAQMGVLGAPEAETFSAVHIPYAYVLFRHGYRQLLTRIARFLEAAGVICIGRYGLWRYDTIEAAMQSGLNAALTLTQGQPSPVHAEFGFEPIR